MRILPPLPTWDGLHPLIIHFPIALLMIAPLFVVLAMLTRDRWSRVFGVSALLLMAFGTLSAFVAVSTGEAAGELAERLPGVEAAIERHADLAELSRTLFTILTLAFAAVIVVPLLVRGRIPRAVTAGIQAIFLVMYLSGTVVLVNAAHQGGRLVHDLGVRALLPAESGLALGRGEMTDYSDLGARPRDDDDDDDD